MHTHKELFEWLVLVYVYQAKTTVLLGILKYHHLWIFSLGLVILQRVFPMPRLRDLRMTASILQAWPRHFRFHCVVTYSLLLFGSSPLSLTMPYAPCVTSPGEFNSQFSVGGGNTIGCLANRSQLKKLL